MGAKENGSSIINDTDQLYQYFSVSGDESLKWSDFGEDYMHSVLAEILTWKTENNRKNVFIVNSYQKRNRNKGAFYMARYLLSSGVELLFVRSMSDIRELKTDRKNPTIDSPKVLFYHINKAEDSTFPEVQEIVEALSRKRLKNIPVVVSLPEEYAHFYMERDDDFELIYPQNSISRAFLMFSIAILITPLIHFPFMQLQTGKYTAVNDPGLLITGLFLYAVAMIVPKVRKIPRASSYLMLLGAILFVAPAIMDLLIFSVPVISPPANTDLPEFIIGYPLNFIVNVPTFTRLGAMTIFIAGFTGRGNRRMLLALFIAGSLMVYISTFIAINSPALAGITLRPQSYPNEILAYQFFVTRYGNPFMDSLLQIPVSILYFAVYYRISRRMKTDFRTVNLDEKGFATYQNV